VEASQRDSTQDWEIPKGRGPLLVGEIELRVDEALAIARASEEGVKEIGAAAIDAARQARRAAELAESASAAAVEARETVARTAREAIAAASVGSGAGIGTPGGATMGEGRGEAPVPEAAAREAASQPRDAEGDASPSPDRGPDPSPQPQRLTGEARLRHFTDRCDRVSARLRALERRPGAPAPASAAEGRRRGAG
jgi:hypothetical protein